MVLVDKNTMTETSGYRCCNCGLTVRDLLQFISSLLLPLMLGVFTIIITIRQQHVATIQRLQDLNNSAQQRAEDRQMALEQRAQDKLIATEQRQQDERRRLQDLEIAEKKRDQDNILAEKQRDMLEKQRSHELAVEAARYDMETEKYLDALLVTYMKEIGNLFMDNNDNLTSNSHIRTLVRLKTLTIARQLDPSRNTQLVQFLYEAGQLFTNQNPLDLSGANFDGINLSSTTQHLPMHRLFLFGAHLNNASFRRLDLSNANFSKAHLKGASFVDTYLAEVDFTRTILLEADFEESKIVHASFNDTNMIRVKFSHTIVTDSVFIRTIMHQISIQSGTDFSYCTFTNVDNLAGKNWSAMFVSSSTFKNMDLRDTVFTDTILSNTHFINTQLDGSDFSRSKCEGNHFTNLNLDKVNFTHAILTQTVWTGSTLTNIDFTGANLKSANFIGTGRLEKLSFVEAQAQGIILTYTVLKSSNFSRCQCSNANFIKTKILNVSFNNAILNNANFSNSVIHNDVTFQEIDGFEADFSLSDVSWCNFAQSRLRNASFAWAYAVDTNFTDVEVNGIDFSHTSLQDAQIKQEQLDLAMSISGTSFDGKNHRNPNLLKNSGYECNTRTMINSTFWQFKPYGVEIIMTPEYDNTCSFTVSQPVIISQLVDVARYRRLIDKGRARGYVITHVWNTSTIIYVTMLTSFGLSYNHSFEVPKSLGFQLLQPAVTIPPGTTRLLLSVMFEAATSRCGYIDLSVQDDNIRPE